MGDDQTMVEGEVALAELQKWKDSKWKTQIASAASAASFL
jgi:hypothetical protein